MIKINIESIKLKAAEAHHTSEIPIEVHGKIDAIIRIEAGKIKSVSRKEINIDDFSEEIKNRLNQIVIDMQEELNEF